MNFVDYIIIACVLFGALLGLKKGVIKSLVQLIGVVAILIISYYLKDVLASYVMDFMPFFNFAGFEGITAINILIYELLSFVVIFIVLYCILSILLTLSGVIEKLLELTIVLAIPSKILGAIVGTIEGLVLGFMITFLLFHAGISTKYVNESYMGVIVLERTPIVGPVMAKTTLALEDINDLIAKKDEDTDVKAINAQALSVLIHYNIVTKETVQKLIDDGKIELENVQFN